MEKELIKQRLRDTIAMLRSLKPEQFKYSRPISAWNEEGCGTVCCVYGWYPKYFPEAGLHYWRWSFGSRLRVVTRRGTTPDVLCAWHGLNDFEILYLFYGDGEGLGLEDSQNLDLTVEGVIKRFENFLTTYYP